MISSRIRAGCDAMADESTDDPERNVATSYPAVFRLCSTRRETSTSSSTTKMRSRARELLAASRGSMRTKDRYSVRTCQSGTEAISGVLREHCDSVKTVLIFTTRKASAVMESCRAGHPGEIPVLLCLDIFCAVKFP